MNQAEAQAEIESQRSAMNDHNDQAWADHPALGLICDYRDDGEDSPEALKELATLIDTAYPAFEFHEDGGVNGKGAKALIESCFTAFENSTELPAIYDKLLAGEIITADQHAAYMADL